MADTWLRDWWERRVNEDRKYGGTIEVDINIWHYWVIYSVDEGFPEEASRQYSFEYLWVARKDDIRNQGIKNPAESTAWGIPGVWLEHVSSLLVDLISEKIDEDRKSKNQYPYNGKENATSADGAGNL